MNRYLPYPVRLALLYLCFSVLWILTTDHLLFWLARDAQQAATISTYKGWFFVSASSVLIYISLFNEFSQRKHAENALRESEARARMLADVIEKSYQPFASSYTDGRLGTVNAAFCELVGYTAEELETISWIDELTPPEWREHEAQSLAELRQTGKPVRYEKEYIRKNGSRVPIELFVHLEVDESDHPLYYYAFITDLTERKRAEDARQKINNELEARVSERTAQLEASNQELEAFSYSVSHDLRTPLRHIDGYSRMLVDEFGDRLNPQARSYLESIAEAAAHMRQLIDALLNFSRLTRSELHRQTVYLSEIAQAIASQLRPSTAGRVVEFIIQKNLVVYADETLLRIVLENLLGNAWKFTSKRSRAIVEFGSILTADRYGNRADQGERVFFVRDNGAGFDMSYANKLFGAFQRLHPAAEFPGTGVGLATVQRIIHRHGGKVWAEATPDQGATFYFTLPAQEAVRPGQGDG